MMFKNMKSHQVLLGVGLLVLAYAVFQYSHKKGLFPEPMSNDNNNNDKKKNKKKPTAFAGGPSPVDDSSIYNQLGSTSGDSQMVAPNCSGQSTINPNDLLPKDSNGAWAMKPMGSGDFLGVNLLNAGYLIGINTVGSSLRNANQQIRSDPPNPQLQVSPWNNTTIEPDIMRAPLEIGCNA